MSKKLRDLVHDIQYTHDLTLEEVAKRIGRTRPYLSKVMNREEENDEMYDLITRKFGQGAADVNVKNPGSEYQGKYIGVLEQLLNQDLKEIKSRIESLEQMLSKITDSFGSAEARQKAAYQITYFLAEELATVPRVPEKEGKKLISEKRKLIEQRLVASLQEDKRV